jgi:hypothetical protein
MKYYGNSMVEFSPHTLFSDFDYNMFNSFAAIYRFLPISHYIFRNNNCKSEDGLNGRNTLFCKNIESICV